MGTLAQGRVIKMTVCRFYFVMTRHLTCLRICWLRLRLGTKCVLYSFPFLMELDSNST